MTVQKSVVCVYPHLCIRQRLMELHPIIPHRCKNLICICIRSRSFFKTFFFFLRFQRVVFFSLFSLDRLGFFPVRFVVRRYFVTLRVSHCDIYTAQIEIRVEFSWKSTFCFNISSCTIDMQIWQYDFILICFYMDGWMDGYWKHNAMCNHRKCVWVWISSMYIW